MKIENGYPAHTYIDCIDAFVEPDGDWSECPCCGLTPKVWEFNNGRSTVCGCAENKYDHFSIHAESIMSVHVRTSGKQMNEYDSDALRKNWNHWCATGEIVFEYAGKRTDGRW